MVVDKLKLEEKSREEEKQELLEKIAAEAIKQVPESLHPALNDFIKGYYSHLPLDDLLAIPQKMLAKIAKNTWDFGFTRKPGEIKIRAFTEQRDATGRETPKTVVEIINDNMPFLVDSVSAAINSMGYSTHLIVHPVFQVERDKNNKIISVFQKHTKKKPGQLESYIHCEILESASPEKLTELKEEILKALADVKLAVQDWEPMRKQLVTVIKELEKAHVKISPEELKETVSFLEWIENDHFTFLGCCTYKVASNQKRAKGGLLPENGLGILRESGRQELSHIFEGVQLTPANRRYILEADPIIINKTSQLSLVHRRQTMDSITVKKFDKQGRVIGLYEFVGLFTSVAYHRSAREIPLLKRKIKRILKTSGFSEHWHDGKTLIHILETFPREELFQASEEWLYKTCMEIIQLQNRQRLTLFIRPDQFKRFASCIVYIPRERYDTELRKKVTAILEKSLHGTVVNWQTQLGELAFARVHFTVKLKKPDDFTYDTKAVEQKLVAAALTWRDQLRELLFKGFGEPACQSLYEKYGEGFSRGYQDRFTAQDAIFDIHEMEKAFSEKQFRSSIRHEEGKEKNRLLFKLYSLKGPLSLSDVLPVLKNMNFKVQSEMPFMVTLSNRKKVWIHAFEMETQEGDPVVLDHIRDHFIEGFKAIWKNEVENDGFNRLIVRANFNWQECQLIRSIAKYIRQLQVTFSQVYMEEVLSKYPHITHLVLQLFMCRFDPCSKENRESAQEEITQRIKTYLGDVDSLDEDRILRKFMNTVSAIIRTNYFQREDCLSKPYISFKIDCSRIEEMPLPRPLYEIFVFSPRFEAIHLRGGKVARGGIRWSDRKEDFRNEILGLMKTQIVKNAVIVPTGSKGGFVVKRPPAKGDQNALLEEVVACYKTMMKGLLDLTDNLQDDLIVSPKDVVKWDEDDPYLVVAADKGTSTFSDYANKISADYDFWLGDAFASGGSTGYDHKKMAITARGAWESVRRHFREMDVDADREEITVVGIGDMSGDVFGNGMLLSKKLKLVAAFNHMHIFVDPSPNPKVSFEERKRLFNLSRSTWANYDPKLISKGGGVFDRKAKSIEITPEMKELFDIRENQLAPSDLIRYLLKAQVDLLWFGGIGTYVKAVSESNSEVEDFTNDALRINGRAVRAKVIAEGANLGITQLGRVEYAKKGGRINTDAIDNSAGVDCSDHEVNIKTLLGKVVAEKKLTISKRNKLLQDMTDEVATLVLKDNFWQNQVISLVKGQGFRLMDEQVRLMRDLEAEGLLNRAIEGLPDDTEIARRIVEKQGLTRPEIAVLLAYAKISLKHQFIHSELPDIEILHSRLLSYFPQELREKYDKEIQTHPLRRDIIVTLVTNSIVNRMGITFVHEMKRQLEVEGADVMSAYLIVRDILDLVSLWHDLEDLHDLPPTFQTDVMLNIYENVKRFTDWFLRFNKEHRDVEKTLKYFNSDFQALQREITTLFTTQQREDFEGKLHEYETIGVPEALSYRLLAMAPLVSAPDIIVLSKKTKVDVKTVARIYFALGQHLKFDWLRRIAHELSGENHWQRGASNALIEDLYISQKGLTHQILKKGLAVEKLFTPSGALSPEVLDVPVIDTTLIDLKNAAKIDFSMMTVVNRQLRLLVQNGEAT